MLLSSQKIYFYHVGECLTQAEISVDHTAQPTQNRWTLVEVWVKFRNEKFRRNFVDSTVSELVNDFDSDQYGETSDKVLNISNIQPP
jgi:hypothetical protein